MDLARCLVSSGRADFAEHRDRRRIFEVKSAEYSNRVHRMQYGSLGRIVKSIRQIKSFHTGVEVRHIQANDFRVLSGGFRQQILVRGNYVGNTHISMIGESTWPHDVPFNINRVCVVWNDWIDSNSISVVNFE